jgi:hypothetical protein
MLEKKVGEEAFKKLLERMVTTACQAGSKGVTRRIYMPLYCLDSSELPY